MHLFFFVSNPETRREFINQFEAFVRKYAPKRLSFTYDRAQAHAVDHYRFFWPPGAESAHDLKISVIHLSERTEPFYSLFDMDVSGVFFVSNAHVTNLAMDVERMRMVLPARLFQNTKAARGCVYFRDDIDRVPPDDFKVLSQKLDMPLFVEPPQRVPALCAHVIQNTCQQPRS